MGWFSFRILKSLYPIVGMTEELKETNEDRETKMEVVKKKKQIGFEELGVDPRLVRALHKEGITMPTAVQSEGIPLILVHTSYFSFFYIIDFSFCIPMECSSNFVFFVEFFTMVTCFICI